ncbi:hypothetical protein LTR84_000935 [Exophiala bonariae]|uniref:Major facilitator superfamily (MFS) profile domain-containing protein n=1 Tax=Exophiala bonariae TaxID=1690606 RepID=A0AAV9NRZ9_9EURO|nr:hypothetical protein LTR84_000935 [Exophiala bonariae]
MDVKFPKVVDEVEDDAHVAAVMVAEREREKKLIRKIDLQLLPILFLMLIAAFLDRINIGNARLFGLESDLSMQGDQFNIALFVFFIPYILCELPANILLKNLKPYIWLSTMMIGFGILTICQGLTRSFGGLVACRFFIGAFEAGFFPGSLYLISMYYRRYQVQTRLTFYWSAGVYAGGFSGLLAYGIGHMDGVGGYRAWRWIFLIEGAVTVFIGVMAFFIIPDWPETAKFLKPEERTLLLSTLHEDSGPAVMNRLDKKAMKRAFSDWKIYLGFFMSLAWSAAAYSLALFTPTLLNGFGWSPLRTQLMTIPVFVVGGTLSIVIAMLSDFMKHRFWFIIAMYLGTLLAIVIMFTGARVTIGVRYMAIFFLGTCSPTGTSLAVGWINNNMGGHYKRSIGVAIQVGFANLGGIIASNIFIKREAPFFKTAFSVLIGIICMGICIAIIFVLLLIRENRKRERGERDHRLQLPEDERGNLGDDHPTFRMVY